MSVLFIVNLISFLTNLIVWLVIIYVILGYFLNPYHPVMEFLKRLVSPMLDPIRRLMPQTGMLDFSPLVLLILVQLIGKLLIEIIDAIY
jgi:YggT family protein